MDSRCATIVSLLPYDLVEVKPGLNPRSYRIKKAIGDVFGITHILDNVFYQVNPDPLSDAKDVHLIKVPVPAIEIAQSLISDYVGALLAVDPPDAAPGLMVLVGDLDRKDIAIEHAESLQSLYRIQNAWLSNLVMIADDTWAKTKSPIGISDLQREACRMLEYKRDWLNPLPDEILEKCPICKSAINPGALKCLHCQTILNQKEYDRIMTAMK